MVVNQRNLRADRATGKKVHAVRFLDKRSDWSYVRVGLADLNNRTAHGSWSGEVESPSLAREAEALERRETETEEPGAPAQVATVRRRRHAICIRGE